MNLRKVLLLIIMLTFSLNLAYADQPSGFNTTLVIADADVQTISDDSPCGVRIQTNKSVYLVGVNKMTNDQSLNFHLSAQAPDNTVVNGEIANVSFSGVSAVFPEPILLNASTTYYLQTFSGGVSRFVAVDSAVSYPITNEYIEVDQTFLGLSTNTGFTRCLVNITTQDVVDSPIETNITNGTYYNSKNISVQVNATQETSISYHLNNDDLIVSDGLIAYYQAENNASDRLGTYNGTLNGGVNFTNSVNSSYMNAFEFDGVDDYVDVALNTEIETACLWVKNSLGSNQQYYLVDTTGLEIFGIRSNNILNIYESGWKGFGYTPSTNFEHYCIVYNTDHYDLYVNGSFESSAVASNKISVDYISGTSTNSMNGSIDDVRIYNRALNQTEITQLYENAPYTTVYDNPLSNGLLAYYQAENNTDDRQERFDGTPNGGLTYTSSVNSSFGEAFQFNGVDSYVLSDNVDDFSGEGTISFWTKANDSDSARVFINNDDFSPSIQLRVTSNNWNIFARNTAGTSDSVVSTLVVDQWVYFTISYDTNGVRVYKDSSLIDTFSITGDFTDTGDVWLGRYGNNNADYYNGSLDEFRIYNRALNQTEITELYQLSPNYITSGNFNLTNVSDGQNNITFFTQFASLRQSFYVDTTKPTIINSIGNRTILDYNFTNQFNGTNTYCTDDNLETCQITITGLTTDLNNTEINLYSLYNGNITYTIFANDSAGNSNTVTGTIFINPYQRWNFKYENGSTVNQYTLGGLNFNGTAEILTYGSILEFGSNTLLFEKTGFADQTIPYTLTNQSNINDTYNVSTAKIVVTIRDKQNGSVIVGPQFNLQFVATVGAEGSTTNGTFTVENPLFQNEEYLLLVSSSNYLTENKIFTFTNEEVLSVTVYMQLANQTDTGFVSVKAVDSGGAPVEDVTVQALQYDPSTSEFVVVSEKKTGTDGIGIVNVILETEVYKFRAILGDISVTTIQQTIDTDKEVIISLPAISPAPEQEYKNLNILATESFNSTDNVTTISVEYVDTDGIDRTVCIYPYKVIQNKKILQSNIECYGPSSSGEFDKQYLIESAQTWMIEVGLITGDGFIPYYEFVYPAETSITEFLEDNYITALVCIIMIIGSIWLGIKVDVVLGSIVLAIACGLGYTLAPSVLTGTITAFFFFIGCLTMWGGSKK